MAVLCQLLVTGAIIVVVDMVFLVGCFKVSAEADGDEEAA